MRVGRVLGLCLAALASIAWMRRDALAVCVRQPFEVVWSYPADGQTDVPTNAKIWILGSDRGPDISVEVNGRSASQGAHPWLFEPGALEPQTTYQVVVSSRWSLPDSKTFTFVTGPGAVIEAPPTSPRIDRIKKLPSRELTASCMAAVKTQDCFDTGQDTHFEIESEPAPLAWIMHANGTVPGHDGVPPFMVSSHGLWPGTCGMPEIFGHSSASYCFTLVAATATGLTTTAEPVCTGAGGCQIGRGRPTSVVPGLLLFAAFAWVLCRPRRAPC